MTEGGALSHNNDIIDIYSNSWGPSDAGFLVLGPDVLAKMALEEGAKEVSHFIHAMFCLYRRLHYVHHSMVFKGWTLNGVNNRRGPLPMGRAGYLT